MTYEIPTHKLTVKDLEKIVNTSDSVFFPESDYGVGEVFHKDGKFHLYGVPMYGGAPFLALVDTNAAVILNEVQYWT